MKRKNALLLASAVFGAFVLFAFKLPERAREQFLTVFFPTETRPRAVEHPQVADSKPDLGKSAPKPALKAPDATLDTFDPLEERYDDFLNSNPNPVDLKDPKVVEKNVEYDPVSDRYIVTEKIGDDFFRAPTYMTFEEYVEWKEKKQQQEYFDKLQGVATGDGKKSGLGVGDPIAKFDIKNSLIDRLFGGTNVDIRPQGNINLTFGFDYQKILNPILTRRQQTTGNFDFDMDINMGATGKIGEKLNLNFNYNTQATFDFDNQMKLNYDTKNFSEDEILQNIEAGNVSMPLRSQLIKGAQNLFGIKAEMKFGHLRLTTVASQQRSRQNNLTVQGGAQVQQFAVPIDEYDENRHFFLSQYNRNTFESSLRCLPVPMTLFRITRMEVWLTNDQLKTENIRDIVALADLAEPFPAPRPGIEPPIAENRPGYAPDNNNIPLPANGANTLYPDIAEELRKDSTFRHSDKVIGNLQTTFPGIRQIRDFEKQRCRLLSPQEYSFHEQLGFVSINLNVQPDQIVGVAVEYTYNGKPYKIGEFTSDFQNGDTLNQNVLFVKMLKSTTANVKLPIWDLMMKNVYAIGTANLDPQEFRFDIVYEDPGKGQKRFLNGSGVPAALNSKPLLQLFRMDTLNQQQDPGPDGVFDFVPGLTINLRSGRVMFPVLEPFGDYLFRKWKEADPSASDTILSRTILYRQLYDSTLFRAREFQHLNRFTLKGSYKSASNAEISLGTFNLPQGSVRVSGGGRQLIEGQDYEVDYNIGKVKILNDAILQSGQNVNVSFEDNTLFGFNSRTMLGIRADYDLNKDVKLGATFMNLFERPLTQKVNFGDDPINNKMYGLDFSISKEAPWLTKLVDKLPLIETKEPSTVQVQAEVAALDPGHARAINQGDGGGGIVYIDDFEGSTSGIPLTTPANGWVLSSTPSRDPKGWLDYKEADSLKNRVYSANRSRLSWYIADPSARDNVDDNNPYSRPIQYQDLFPNRQLTPLEQSNLRPLDVTINPRERGPYNFEIETGYPDHSAGLTPDGELRLPETRWAGFMRGLNTNDFEAANIEFVEFWMLNPYMSVNGVTPEGPGGEMFIDLGSINEDLMRDSRQFFENAIPVDGNGAVAETQWGRVPVLPPVVIAFDNDPTKRVQQDVGFDGLDDVGEQQYFADYVTEIRNSGLNQSFKDSVAADPSNDNFRYFRDPAFQGQNLGLLERYRKFNSPQGNSPVNETSNLNPSATNQPDIEDLNRDNSLNETEAFFRYRIPMPRLNDSIDINDPVVKRLVTDRQTYVKNGQTYIWYRFKVPLDADPNVRTEVGGIQDFRSVRFVRTVFKGFTERTTFRFATFELGRNQWRRYTQRLLDRSNPDCRFIDNPKPGTETSFDVNSVSIEENAARFPFNYTIPDGVQREQSVGAFPDVLQNEQSLSLEVCNLQKCDDRAIFKTLNMDLRQFKRLKMFVHAEETDPVGSPLDSGKIAVFVRLGSDFFRNYYEYEVPLRPSDPLAVMGLSADSRDYKREIWPDANSVDFPLDLLVELKKERNAQGGGANLEDPYSKPDPNFPGHMVRVVGNPNLGLVKGIMVGIRNIDTAIQGHCAEIWLNELRLNGFNEKGGYAGIARMDMKLADFGNVALSTNYTSIGWGGIEQKLIQRQREEVIQLDFSTNLELGKLLPEKSGIKVPFYWQYSNVTANPEYDPYDLDIKLADKLRAAPDNFTRDSIRQTAQNVTVTRGYNFTNVRKERAAKAKPWPWAIENFSLTYAYNNQIKRNPFIARDDLKQYKGGLDYQWSTGLKPIQPFKKLIKKDKYLKFISEFNFNPLPNTYGFSTTLERFFQKTTYRFVDDPDPARNTFYNKRFTWDRNYDLGWDISKSLKFNYDATARSLIDEPDENFIRTENPNNYREVRRDSILTNLRNFGRPKNFQQNISLNYTLPFKTIPFLDFITMKASYTGGYTWTAASLKMQYLDPANRPNELRNLGHVIQNRSTRQINGDFNFETLYNKSKYLGKINKPAKKSGSKKDKKKDKSGGGDLPGAPGDDDAGNPDGSDLGPGSGKFPGGRDRRNPDADKDAPLDPLKPPTDAKPGGLDPANPGGNRPGANRPGGKDDKKGDDKNAGDKDDKNGKDKKTKDKKSGPREPSMAERIAIRPLMLLRKARFTYSENFGSTIPGFLPEAKRLGMNEGFKSPGWAYLAGFAPDDAFLDDLAAQNYMTQRPELNQEATRTYTQSMDGGLTIEPFADFRIEITAQRQYTRNNSQLFKDTLPILSPDEVSFAHRANRDMGSFTTTFFAMNTLFNSDIDGLFARFQANRTIISNRLGELDPTTYKDSTHSVDEGGYRYGYGKIQQEVLLPAFIAAYTEKDASLIGLDVFKTRPAVNWKLNYNGLSKVGKLNKIFSSVQISHGYKNTLQVNSYNTDLFYEGPYQLDQSGTEGISLNGNYIARYEIPQVVISEQMQPLLGIDVKLKNDMSFKVDMKKSRTLSMSFIDYQLAESRSTGYTAGFGYRLKNVNIPFLTGKKAKKSKSKKSTKKADDGTLPPDPKGGGKGDKPQGNDMNFKFDFDYRDDVTVNHRLDQADEAVPTRGTRTITISPSVDYALNKRLKLRLFCDYRRTEPKTSASFPITNINAGATVQFSLN